MSKLSNWNQKLTPAYQPENIIQYKQKLDFNTGVQNVAIATRNTTFWHKFIESRFHVNQVFLVSFEDAGILLMRLQTLTGDFANDNLLLEPEHFRDLKIKHGMLMTKLDIKSDQGRYILAMATIKPVLKMRPFHAETVTNIDKIIQKYSD